MNARSVMPRDGWGQMSGALHCVGFTSADAARRYVRRELLAAGILLPYERLTVRRCWVHGGPFAGPCWSVHRPTDGLPLDTAPAECATCGGGELVAGVVSSRQSEPGEPFAGVEWRRPLCYSCRAARLSA